MIELEELPELVNPVMVAAFEGWNDAADAASNAVRHLADVLDADLFGAMDAEEYYDFQVNRPVLALDDEGEREIVWPTTRFSVARVPVASAGSTGTGSTGTGSTSAGATGASAGTAGGPGTGTASIGGAVAGAGSSGGTGNGADRDSGLAAADGAPAFDDAGVAASSSSEPGFRDVILVHGIEPNMRWRTFCEELFDLARDLGVTTIVSLGALLADVPHTRPVPVSGSSNNEELQGAHGLDKPTLQGPTGINGVLQEMARHEEIDLVSFWAAVPHYVAQAPCPKATLALIRRIEDVLDLTIPLGELPEEARAWETGVDELAAEDSEVAEYVRTLEEAKDTAELPEASGEAIAREFERYLRRHERRRRGGTDDGPTTGL